MQFSDLCARARAWVELDPDPQDRRTVLGWIEAEDRAALARAFGPRPGFGTAGIRAPLGPGPAGLNRLVARQVGAALGAVLARKGQAQVVVGRDGRHGSRAFAEEIAQVLGTMGHRVLLAEEVMPTPLLAHAVRDQGCRAGVMVTASHNPPGDNGIKVYGEDGAQIVPPMDREIEAELLRVDDLCPLVRPLAELRAEGFIDELPDTQAARYRAAVLAGRRASGPGLRFAYTALHGVASASLRALLASTGHQPVPVPEQDRPDPNFPTVRFPNPEEPGALDRACALARREGLPLVLANDPDGDRLAVAVATGEGGYRRLSGDEVGLLLAEHLLHTGGPFQRPPLLLNTIVSSSLLADIAAAHGARYAQALTGFKWLLREAATQGGPLLLAYEEALGYCVGEVVRDKDGLSAALHLLDLAASWRDRGGLLAALDALALRHGAFHNAQLSATLPGLEGRARIEALMAGLRAAPPARIADAAVLRLADLREGVERDLSSGEARPTGLPRSDVLRFELEGGERVLVRPSGTEPKIKVYVEARRRVAEGERLADARRRIEERGEALLAWARGVIGSPEGAVPAAPRAG